MNVSVADVVKFALTRVKIVIFFSRTFISHVKNFDLFGGFTDICFAFPRIDLHGTDLEFSKIFGKSKIKKKLKNSERHSVYIERNSKQSCVFFKIAKISENFRIFEKHTALFRIFF